MLVVISVIIISVSYFLNETKKKMNTMHQNILHKFIQPKQFLTASFALSAMCNNNVHDRVTAHDVMSYYVCIAYRAHLRNIYTHFFYLNAKYYYYLNTKPSNFTVEFATLKLEKKMEWEFRCQTCKPLQSHLNSVEKNAVK